MIGAHILKIAIALYLASWTLAAYNAFDSLYPRFSLLEPRRGGGHSSGGGGGHSDAGTGGSGGTTSGDAGTAGTSSGGTTSSDTGTTGTSGTSQVNGSSTNSGSCNDITAQNSVTGSSDVTGGSTNCVAEFGAGWAVCYGLCYNRGIGEVCCAGNYKCSAGKYCGYGSDTYCCATSLSPSECASASGVPQPPSSFQPGDANASGTATQYPSVASSTKKATSTACSSAGSVSANSGSSAGAVSGSSGSYTFDVWATALAAGSSLTVLAVVWL